MSTSRETAITPSSRRQSTSLPSGQGRHPPSIAPAGSRPHVRRRSGRRDVLVAPEEVVRVVLRLHGHEPIEVHAVGGADPVGLVLPEVVHVDAIFYPGAAARHAASERQPAAPPKD